MGTIVVPNAVKREKGVMYYIDGEGNLCQAKMGKGRKKGGKNKSKSKKKKAVKK
jgi:hypothetical protein